MPPDSQKVQVRAWSVVSPAARRQSTADVTQSTSVQCHTSNAFSTRLGWQKEFMQHQQHFMAWDSGIFVLVPGTLKLNLPNLQITGHKRSEEMESPHVPARSASRLSIQWTNYIWTLHKSEMLLKCICTEKLAAGNCIFAMFFLLKLFI